MVAQIAGYGLLAFRDPHGIRPGCASGARKRNTAWSGWPLPNPVALEGSGFNFVRDVARGEAVFIDLTASSTAACARRKRSTGALHFRIRVFRPS